ncbi:MAG: hypothetical protein GY720_15620 [bacterium]|nr:hypothetical protein [bacterium]
MTNTNSIDNDTTRPTLPSLEAVTSGTLAAVFGLLLAGLVLAMAGFHHAWLQAPLGGLIAVLMYRTLPHNRTSSPLPRGVLVVLLLIIGTSVVTSLALRSEHVIAGRDGATYANTASFLVDEGGLFPNAIESPFVGAELDFEAPGFVTRDDGTFWQQFLHATSALYAFFGEIFGKSAIFGVNAFLSGAGLLTLFALASRFVTGWWAVLATGTGAASLPFVYYSRGTFSEMTALLLILGGLWVGQIALESRPQHGIGAGLLLGAATLARVDAWMIGVALGLLFASVVWLRESDSIPIVRQIYTGFLAIGAVGLIDMALFSEPYVVNVGTNFLALLVLTVGLRLIAPSADIAVLRRVFVLYEQRLSTIGRGVAIVAVGVIGYLWFGRGLLDPDQSVGVYGIAALQASEGLPIEPDRAYTELTVWWLSWYLGIPLLVAGFAGFVAALQRSLRPGTAALRLAVVVFLVPALTYLIRPSVNPDHIWAIRRFLPIVLPLLIIAGVATVAAVGTRIAAVRRAELVTGALVLFVTLPVVATTIPLYLQPDRTGLEEQMNELCEAIGPGRSALIINDDPDVALSGRLGPPLRSWCHASVAGIAAGDSFAVVPDVVIAADPALLPTEPEVTFKLAADAWQSRLVGPPAESVLRSVTVWIDETCCG